MSIENKPRYFSYDPDSCFDTHESAEDARKSAEETIDYYRDNAGDGWSEHVEGVCWGVILSVVEETENRPRYEDDGCSPDCEFVVDYGLTEAPDPFQELAELRRVAALMLSALVSARDALGSASQALYCVVGRGQHCDCGSFETAAAWRTETHGGDPIIAEADKAIAAAQLAGVKP